MKRITWKRIFLAILCGMLMTAPAFSANAEGETAAEQNWQLTGQVGGTTKALCREGTTLYVGSGLHVLVMDASDPAKLRLLGTSAMLPQFVESLASDGNGMLYACCGEGGLVLLDVSTPAEPRILGTLDTLGYTEDVAFYGDYAVLADGPLGLQVADVSDPVNPLLVSSAYSLAYVYAVALQGEIVYAAGGGSGLFTVDLTDPLNPKEAGLLPLDGFQYDVLTANGRLYTAGAWGGVHVLDITDPLNSTKITNAYTPGWAMALAADGNGLLVLDGADGALLYGIAGEQPVQMSALTMGGFMMAGTINDDRAFVLDEEFGLIAIDYSQKSQPSLVSRWMPLTDGRRVTMNGTTSYVAGGMSGVHVYDMTKPENPLELSSFDFGGDYVNKVVVDGSTMYAASSGKIQMAAFDVSDPSVLKRISQPLSMDSIDMPIGTAFRSMAVGHGYAFIAGEHEDLSIDISDPQNMEMVSWIPAENVNGDYRGNLFVSTSNSQLQIVDVSDPENIRLASTLEKQSSGEAVRFINDTVLLTSADPGVWIVDVSNPSAPKKIGELKIDGVVMEACIDGATAYLSCLGNGIQIVDLADLANPVLIGQVHTPGIAYDCSLYGDTLVVADSYAGMSVFTRSGAPAFVSNSAITGIPLSMMTDITPFSYESAPTNPEALGKTYSVVVTSTADSGTGSLRDALNHLNRNTTITFDPAVFPPDNPAVILLESPLPEIVADYLTIDASNAGVILDGNKLDNGCGLVLYSSNNRVMGLQILHFPMHGIDLEGSGSIVGGSREIGAGPLGQGNLLSGNWQYGIYVSGSNLQVKGNFIGVDSTGTTAMPNYDGVFVANGRDVIIGGTRAGEGNLISGNTWINLDTWGEHTRVTGNSIGTDVTGTMAINESTAFNVVMEACAINCVIGGTTPAERNIISGAEIGFVISDPLSCQNTVIGNYIGTDITGMKAVPNGSAGGPWVSSHNRIGGTRAGEGNLISGNRFAAVTLGGYGGAQNYVLGNRIGFDAEGGKTLPNGLAIDLSISQSQSAIGGYSAKEGNTVFGNVIAAQISDAGCVNNFIAGNMIECPGGTGVFLRNGARNNFVQTNLFVKGCQYAIWLNDTQMNLLRANIYQGSSMAEVLLTSDHGLKFKLPVITSADGSVVSGTAVPLGLVEIYQNDAGVVSSLGFTLADQDGYFTFTSAEPLTGKQVLLLVSDTMGSTSGFSKPVKVK